MKVLLITSEERANKFYDLRSLPPDWELVFVGSFPKAEEVLAHADADFVVADAVARVGREIIDKMPKLQLIHSEGVGYEGFDAEAARERGIFVCNCAGVNAGAVAEQAILLMLAVLRRLVEGDAMVRAAQQIRAKERYILDGLSELGAMKVGLIGLGAIGKETAKRLRAFGSEVYYTGRRRRPEETERAHGVTYLPLDALLASCDIVSVHIASNKETFRFVGEAELRGMKPGAILINTARGELVDGDALARALREGRLAAAGLDTLYPEPVQPDNPLLHLPEALRHRLTLSPHIGGTTIQSFHRAHRMIWQNLLACAAGETPKNVVWQGQETGEG
ncbi:MAG: 2-hydroxyacid dehydrogenase [Clostridiales Family XIII bacterium]|jgi:phosphoglycerate dehydrogenase-like enzyme|nr:2-hydroxyacid dehydrogenase [Clostridiales Family XIII bacterium]